MQNRPAISGAIDKRHRPLSARGRALYKAIVSYKRTHDGNSPSTRDMMAACGITSTSVIAWNLYRLQQAHLIKLGDGARSICVEGGSWTLDTLGAPDPMSADIIEPDPA